MQKIHERLKSERESLNLTLKEVAAKMGFQNYQTLGSIESGKRELKAFELLKLAQIYGRSVDYFMKPELREQSKLRVVWRNQVQDEETVFNERKFIALCQNYQRLIELNYEEAPVFALEFSGMKKSDFLRRGFPYVQEIAQLLADALNLGSRPACSLPLVLEEGLGFKIIYMDLGFGGSAASTFSDDFGSAMLINASDAPWRRNFDLAHELFHLLTWNLFSEELYSQASNQKSPVEKWADAFASGILLPEKAIRSEVERRFEENHISYISLVEIAREFRVSIDALLWRLVNLKMLPSRHVEKALRKGEIKDIDKKERFTDWEDGKPHLSPRYVALAIKAFTMGKISKAKLAEYVDQPFSNIPSFLRRHGYDENEDYSREFATS